MDVNSFVIGYNKGKASVPPASGGGAELNIAYGDTPPEDTTKLWVKTSEPSGVLISPEVEETEVEGESFYALPSPLPATLAYAGCAAIGTKIYIIGGQTTSGTSTTGSKSVIIFDTETKAYDTLTNALGTAIAGISCAVVGTRIYFAGGGETYAKQNNLIRYFDTETKKLVTCGATMPYEAYGFTCGASGTDVYIFGGRQSSTIDTVYRYDTIDDRLDDLPPLPYLCGQASCVLFGSKFYILAGNTNSYMYCYDIVSLEASIVSKKVDGSNGARAVKLGEDVYMLGGVSAWRVKKVDLQSGKTENVFPDLNPQLGFMAVAAVGENAYAFGGTTEIAETVPTDGAYVFSLNTPVPSIGEGSIYINPQVKNNIFPIIKSNNGIEIEIGVNAVYKGNADGVGEPVEAALYKNGAWTNV